MQEHTNIYKYLGINLFKIKLRKDPSKISVLRFIYVEHKVLQKAKHYEDDTPKCKLNYLQSNISSDFMSFYDAHNHARDTAKMLMTFLFLTLSYKKHLCVTFNVSLYS